MKYAFFSVLVFWAGIVCGFAAPVPVEDLPLVPAPKEIQSSGKSSFKMPPTVTIAAPKALGSEAAILKRILKKRLNVTASPAAGTRGTITLSVSRRIKNREGYELKISRNGISVSGGSPAGVYYGVRTLEQLFITQKKNLPELKIVDEPRFAYRGLMLDPARNFLPAEDVKHFIETMAAHKLNTLHFHLSDDQGWRVEIKNPKYKKLMSVGAQKNKPAGTRGYYTQKEIRDIVKFAAKHHVEVVPEIDMPGHNMGAISAYPELTCEYVRRVNDDPALLRQFPKMEIEIWSKAGVSEALLCAGKKSTYAFFDDVLGELCALFPSKRFHLGGDEAPAKCWDHCKDCQAFMKKEGLKNTQELMAYFFQRNFDALAKAGKTALYWYELDVPNYPKNAVMYSWRMGHTQQAIDRALNEGYKVICCPGEYAYFDYPQVPGEPNHGWMPLTTLKRAYEFDPGYGRPEKQQHSILGCEGTLWAEHLNSLDKIYEKAFPRALALVEAGWTPMSRRDWENFKRRAAPLVRDMRKNGVPAYWPKDDFGIEK
ncbi:MAG: beta-N-acetylhexosaminidase [Opitutales bacterium]|nr:beta-N-acetylhexosaminidase [Opitutales bacterium]